MSDQNQMVNKPNLAKVAILYFTALHNLLMHEVHFMFFKPIENAEHLLATILVLV